MPTHAILGATGGAGSAILHSLLESNISDLTINLLVHSKEKLLSFFPDVESPPSGIKINIFIGSTTDVEALSRCLEDATVIYQSISASAPSKKTSMARSTATAVVKTIETLNSKASQTPQRPTIILNRSSAINPEIYQSISATFEKFLKWAVQDVYDDLTEAAEIYRAAEAKGCLHAIMADAPNLFHPYATKRTGHELFLEGHNTLGVNYADFGAAVMEMALRGEEFRGKAVGVRAMGEVRPAWGPNLYWLASSTLVRLSPF